MRFDKKGVRCAGQIVSLTSDYGNLVEKLGTVGTNFLLLTYDLRWRIL